MAEAYLVDIVRTPVSRKKGALSQVHPADLGAHVITALFDRNPSADPDAVEDVIFGCTDTLGPQSGDIARTCWLATGFAEHVPGVTVDRQCGSSQQAVHFAAQAVLSGTADLDVELCYRFLRDTVWVGVGWYRPGGKLAIHDIARQYLSIVLDGIAHPNGATRG